MKTVLVTILLTVFIIVSCRNESKTVVRPKTIKSKKEESPYGFESLTANQLLPRLFDSESLNDGVISWIPNFEERQIFPLSYDGKCHTVIDTIIHYTDSKSTQKAVVIFATYELRDPECKVIEGCGAHFDMVKLGIATLSLSRDKTWKLRRFKKHFAELGYGGTYRTGEGDAGQISLGVLSSDLRYLRLQQGPGGSTGVFWSYEEWYQFEPWSFENSTYYSETWEYPGDFPCLFKYYNYSSYCNFDDEYMEPDVYVKTVECRAYLDRRGWPMVELSTDADGRKEAKQRFCYSEPERRFQLASSKKRLDQ